MAGAGVARAAARFGPTAQRWNSRTATVSFCSSPRARTTPWITPGIIAAQDPHGRLTAALDAASRKSYASLKAAQQKDYQRLFNRVTADFGKSTPAQLAQPTDQRKLEAARAVDPGTGAASFPIRTLSSHFLLAPGRVAGKFAGALERQQQPALAFGLSRQHQCGDELLAGRSGQPRRVSPAAL